MNRDEVKNIVIEAIKEYLKEMHGDTTTTIEENNVFLGDGSILDSLGFIQVVVDIESQIKEKGKDILLTSKIAMSMEKNPFEKVGTLIDFIMRQLAD